MPAARVAVPVAALAAVAAGQPVAEVAGQFGVAERTLRRRVAEGGPPAPPALRPDPMSWLAFVEARRARGGTVFTAAVEIELDLPFVRTLAPGGIERPSLMDVLDACGVADLAGLAGWIADKEREDEDELTPAERRHAAADLLRQAAELLPGDEDAAEDAAEDASPVQPPAA